MIISCAWCGLFSTDRETWHPPPSWFVSLLTEQPVSHGMCPPCFAKHVRDFSGSTRP